MLEKKLLPKENSFIFLICPLTNMKGGLFCFVIFFTKMPGLWKPRNMITKAFLTNITSLVEMLTVTPDYIGHL